MIAGSMGALGLPAVDAAAGVQSPEAMAAMRGLRTFAVALDQIGDTPRFAAKLPLTERSVGDLLGFPGLFTRSLGNGLAGFDGDYDDLAATINAADAGGTDVSTDGITVSGGVATFTVRVATTTTQDVRVSYVRPAGSADEANPRPAVVLHGGAAAANTIPVTTTLTAALPFRLDTNVLVVEGPSAGEIDQTRAMSFDPAGASLAVSTAASSHNDALSFNARYGFTDVAVTGSASVRLSGDTAFTDPDASGRITQSEWLSTLLPDWAAFRFTDTPGVPDVDVRLSLDSDLTPATSDGTIAYTETAAPSFVDLRPTDPAVTAAPTVPAVSLLALEPFTRIGSADALTGLSEFAATLAGAQARINQRLPLLDKRFGDAFSPADQLQALVEHQGSAAITCGKANTAPPTGADLEGSTWYCQAVTQDAATNVQWNRHDGVTTPIAGATSAATAGTTPTANVTITGVVGEPQVSVDFDVTQAPEGGTTASTARFTAEPRVRSAQELAAALDALPGSTVTAGYDVATQALTYRTQITEDPAVLKAGLDVGDAARLGTGLSGLTSAAPAPVDVDFGSIGLDATYGLLLTSDLAGIDPDGLNGQADRYFMTVGTGPEVYVDSAAVTAPAAMALSGTVGYLGVDATATSWTLAKKDAGAKALRSDISTSAADPVKGADGSTLGSTMLLRRLLDEASPITPQFNLSFDASLDIAASGALAALTTGIDTPSVDLDWHDYDATTALQATPNDAYGDYLQLFDVLPLAQGYAEGSKSAVTLVDDDVDFTTVFGHTIAAGQPLEAQLVNVTTGATCLEVTVTDAHTLTCRTSSQVDNGSGGATTKNGMIGGQRRSVRTGHDATTGAATYADADGAVVTAATTEDSSWRPGDLWRVAGDPTAMRALLLENLFDVANRLDQNTDPGYSKRLPLVGLSPKDLTPQFGKIRDIAAEVGARVPLVTQADVWQPGKAYAVGDLVRPAVATNSTTPPALLYKATAAGTSAATPPAWPAAAGGTVTETAATLTWTAQAPAPTPPQTLQDLVAALSGELAAITAPVGGVTLSAPTVDASLETVTNGSADAPHLQLSVGWQGASVTDAPVSLGLGPQSQLTLHGIAGADGRVGALDVTSASTAKVAFAVPLSPSIPSTNVVVRGDTGITSLTATTSSTTVDLTGSVGSQALKLGTSARLFGRHTPLTGSHTGAPLLSGTLSGFTSSGTAKTGSATTKLVDDATDFVALGITTSAVVTKGTATCTPTAVATHELTCALPSGGAWASGDAYSVAQSANAKVATATGTAFGTLLPGDTITSGAVTCTYATGTKTTGTLACPAVGGSWTAGQAFTVHSGRVLTDAARTGVAPAPRAFDSFAPAPAGSTANNLTAGGSCPVGTLGATTVTCSSALTGNHVWTAADLYRVDLGDPRSTLVDPGRGFDTMGLTGRTLTNTTDAASCVVASATKDTLTCTAPLTGTGKWDADDYYEISGPATAKLGLGSYSLQGTDSTAPEGYAATLGSTLAGATPQQSCTDTPAGSTAVLDDVCAVLAAQLVDPDAAHGTLTAVSGATLTSATPPAVGSPVRNTTAAFSCVVTASTATTFSCPAPSGKAWSTGNAWTVDSGDFLGVLTFHSDIESTTSVVSGLSAAFLGAVAGDEPLQFSLLTATMDLLRGYVGDAFDDTLAAEPMPLIGLDRSAGSHVLDGIQALQDEIAQVAPPEFTAGQTMASFRDSVADYLKAQVVSADATALGGLKILSPTAGSTHDTGITVILLCKPTPQSSASRDCKTDGTDTVENIVDLRVQATIGGDAAVSPRLTKGCGACSTTADKVHLETFDAGLPGLKLDGPSGLDATVGWSYDLDFGLARDVGPYLGTGAHLGGADDTALEVGASVALPTADASTDCELPAGAAAGAEARTEGAVTNPGFSQGRCYQATVGLLQGVIFDGAGVRGSAADGKNADATGLDLKATLDLAPAADAKGRISLDSLTSPEAALPTFKADADANIDLYFVTGVSASGDPLGTTLPSVQGTVHVGFGVNGTLAAADAESSSSASPVSATYSHYNEVSYDDLQMDAGSFINDFAGPIITEVAKITKPFKAIADILMAPIPVLEQIAQMTGQKIGTLIDLLEEAAQTPLAMIRSVISIINMVGDFATRTASSVVGLGAWGTDKSKPGKFNLNPKDTAKGDCGKTTGGTKASKNCQKSFKRGGTSYKQTVVQTEACAASGCKGTEMARTMTRATKATKFAGAGISFPFLDDTSQVFGMLVGEDATLVRVDPGAFGVSTSLEYSFGPFMAGPIPVDISIGATIGISAHFAMGYDTRGISEVLKQSRDGYDPNALTDGIFIDDLDRAGNDVDEIQLTFVATLGASVSVSVFKVGLYGGVGITIGFDLVDPDHDGKLYIDEIEQFKDNPICLFKVQGLLDFFFGFFVEVDLTFWSKRWDVELFRLKPPIKLFEVQCERFEPTLAVVEGGNLRLNAGDVLAHDGHTYAFNRHYKSTRNQEKLVLRQLTPFAAGEKTSVQVEFSGLTQVFDVPVGGRVVADLGSDQDVLELASGSTAEGTDIPWKVPATVSGGSGNDKLTTGDGDDVVNGGAHPAKADAITSPQDDDKVSTGAGDDDVTDTAGTNTVDAGLGDDTVVGGSGTDRLTGNAGSDYVSGGAGDDVLTGGPGMSQAQVDVAVRRNPALTSAQQAALKDGADVVVGGGGADSLTGHFGDDTLFGDAESGVSLASGVTNTPRNRLAAIRGEAAKGSFSLTAACATGAAGSDGDDQLNGESGADTVVAGGAADRLTGGPDADRMCGGDGADLLEGDSSTATVGGNDLLLGGAGNDELHGRLGNDTLGGDAGEDLVDGDAGDDRLTGGAGADAIDGGSGRDIVLGDGGTIPVGATIGTAGNDVAALVESDTGTDAASSTTAITCQASAVVLAGGRLDLDGDGTADTGRFEGHRVLGGLVVEDTTAAAAFNGTIGDRVVTGGLVQGGTASIPGLASSVPSANGADSDCIIGGDGADAVFAGPGDDTVLGGTGADYAQGDTGADLLRGYQGDDRLRGGAGPDALFGDTGEDRLEGEAGNDDLHGGIGADTAFGGAGDDSVAGEDGNDRLVGGSATAGQADGDDSLDGGAGEDVMAGDNAALNATGGLTLHDLATPASFHGDDTLLGRTGNDTAYGGGGDDVLRGQEQNDLLEGNSGADELFGDAGPDRLLGGSEQAGTDDATGDTLRGGQGDDVLLGDNGTVDAALRVTLLDVPFAAGPAVPASSSGPDTAYGDEGNDLVYGQGGADTVHGDLGVTTGTGDDALQGGPGDDVLWGAGGNDRVVGGSGVDQGGPAGAERALAGVNDGDDTVHGGTGTDVLVGDNAKIDATGVVTRYDVDDLGGTAPAATVSGNDVIDGDDGADRILGEGGNDTLRGGNDADAVEGDSGADRLEGQAGDDRLIGGSTVANYRDGDDTVIGGDGVDTLTGDNATLSPTGAVALLDVRTRGGAVGAEAGNDLLYGDTPDGSGTPAADLVYGQSGADTVHGGGGNDRVQGNAGADTLNGDDGADQVVGGSGTDNGGAAGALRELANTLDSGDLVHGNAGADALSGDNAKISATGVITVYDEDVSGLPAPGADVSGGDTVFGDDGPDAIDGQGGNDTLSGDEGNDVIEGDTGADTVSGGTGDDNLVGGSTHDVKIRDGAETVGGQATGDTVSGDAGVDVILGDDGVVTGSGRTATWTFYDVDLAAGPHAAADLSGPDALSGGTGEDRVFGQGADDRISGGTDDDLIQGNAGADAIDGNAGADDITGGSSIHYRAGTLTELRGTSDAGDSLRGDDVPETSGAADLSDVLLGDNGRITRGPVDVNTQAASRSVLLYDVAVVGAAAQPSTAAAGADTLSGNAGRDLLLGQGGADTIRGNAGDDVVEGGAAADTIAGDAGDDDLIGGGSSKADGVVRHTAPAATSAETRTNLADGGDTITGGAGEDAVLADNGVIARLLSGTGAWTYQPGPFAEVVRRTVQAPVLSELAGAYGDDTLGGGDGHDELYGELGNDVVNGDAGDDALLGDLGRVTLSVNGSNGKAQSTISDSAKFLSEVIHATGSLQRDAVLYDVAVGGRDALDGGLGNDAVHAGAGADTLHGNASAKDTDASLTTVCKVTIAATCDRDVLFGGDGDDNMWGGTDKDHMYGGYGSDHLDVVRPGTVDPKSKMAGPDVMYGGWQQDAMQADVSSPNPNGDDKLIDSVGVYNVYYVCEGAYGGSSVVRSPSPSMQSTIQSLALADGAVAVTDKASSGFNELSMVFTNEFGKNSSPAFADSPGHFTCG